MSPLMLGSTWLMPMLLACGSGGPPEVDVPPLGPRAFRLVYSHSVHGEIEPCG
jgi:hypothetical protein